MNGADVLLAIAGGVRETLAELAPAFRLLRRLKEAASKGCPHCGGPLVLEPLAREDIREAFSGVVTDSLGRKQYYQQGKHVKNPSPAQKVALEKHTVRSLAAEQMHRTTLGDGREVSFVPHPKAAPGEVTVMVDVKALDAGWAKDGSYYLPPGKAGASEIGGRREEFTRFLQKGEPVQAPRATVDADGTVSFTDGRHRFAVLRDAGAKQVAVTLPREHAARLGVRVEESANPKGGQFKKGGGREEGGSKDAAASRDAGKADGGRGDLPPEVADAPWKTEFIKALSGMTLYRGTGRGFSNDHGVAGKGQYWSGSRDVAAAYGSQIATGSIELENPLVATYRELDGLQTRLYGKPLTGFEADLSEKFDAWLRENGYDGVALFDPEISLSVPQEVVKLARPAREDVRESFSGVVVDTLGRRQYYQSGKHVKNPSPEQKERLEKNTVKAGSGKGGEAPSSSRARGPEDNSARHADQSAAQPLAREDHPKPKRPPLPKPKHVARLERFKSHATRRRVLHGLRNERQLADAVGGYNLPDSEPADVVWIASPGGELVTDPAVVRSHLLAREDAVRRLKADPDGPQAGELRQLLSTPCHFFEVKTLITQQGEGKVSMSGKAQARKQRWVNRYHAGFTTVGFDDRKGAKHSGHRLYFKPGIGSMKLSAMTKAASFDELLEKVAGGA